LVFFLHGKTVVKILGRSDIATKPRILKGGQCRSPQSWVKLHPNNIATRNLISRRMHSEEYMYVETKRAYRTVSLKLKTK